MPGKNCYHCRAWVDDEDAKTHDCWTTTDEKLTRDLSEDLFDAWERLRETAVEFGEQRSYASHKSIMFSRKSCYFFVRPKKAVLEVVIFLGRVVKHPLVRKTQAVTKTKVSHVVHINHRDEVETPLTDWLREAYDFAGAAAKPTRAPVPARKKKPKKKKNPVPKKKTRAESSRDRER